MWYFSMYAVRFGGVPVFLHASAPRSWIQVFGWRIRCENPEHRTHGAGSLRASGFTRNPDTCSSTHASSGRRRVAIISSLSDDRFRFSYRRNGMGKLRDRNLELKMTMIVFIGSGRLIRSCESRPCAFLWLAAGAWTMLRLERKNVDKMLC